MKPWSRLCSGAARWLAEEPPGQVYASGALPMTLAEQQRLVQRHRLAELLPYERWDPEHQVCINADGSYGFVLEVAPATGMDRARLDVLSGLLTQGLKTGACLQILLYASPAIRPGLRSWQQARAKAPYDALALRRTQYLGNAGWRSLLQDHPFLLRDFRLFICLMYPPARGIANPAEEYESLLQAREAVRGILESASLSSRVLDGDGFVNLLDTLLNPADERPALHWQEGELLSEQVVDGDSILFVGRDGLGLSHGAKHVTVQPYSVRLYPSQWAGWQMADLIGDLFTNNLRLPCPFLHVLSVLMPDQAGVQGRSQVQAMRATQMADSPVGRFMPIWRERRDDWQLVARLSGSGHRMLRAWSQLVLFTEQGNEKFCEQRLLALYESHGWLLRRDRFVALHAFLSALPLANSAGLQRESDTLFRRRTMLSWSAVNVAPWTAEWKGTNTPLLMLIGRRGQIMYLDPFDNDQGNYNIAVAAASGAGKSFLTQELLISLLGTGGRAWVIDSGRSYERLCRLVNGSYIDFTPDQQLSLNPFSGLRDMEAELPLLKTLLAHMAAFRQPLNSLQLSHLERAIKSACSAHGAAATITTVAAELLAVQEDSAAQVGRMLYPYTREGLYGRWFEGPSNVLLDNDLVVLELGALDDKLDLQQVILMLLILRINREMYHGDRGRRKLCIIDEAWRLMTHGDAGKFIETGYRTARKYGSAYMTVTQGIDDYYQSPTARAALQNSDWVLLLRQKAESLIRVRNEGQLHLDDARLQLLTSLETRQGKYSELAVIAPGGGMAVGRLVVDPFSEKLYSTRAEECVTLEQYMQQGCSLVEAIERLVAESAGR